MIMEPMAENTSEQRAREERGKFRDGLKRGSGSLKRKREEDGDGEHAGERAEDGDDVSKKKKKAVKGPKGPNPLAVKKPKKKPEGEDATLPPRKGKEGKKEGGGEASSSAQTDRV
jgi:U3 small nucleolar RNA-associated protein 23